MADKAGMLEEVLQLVNQPDVAVVQGAGPAIKARIAQRLSELGWAPEPQVDQDYNVKINAMRTGVALTVQTGNVARAFYDLLKFQAMYLTNKITAAVLILPSTSAARTIGGNVADYGRVSDELEGLFCHIITVPTLLIGFE